jgi:hypothetical protein
MRQTATKLVEPLLVLRQLDVPRVDIDVHEAIENSSTQVGDLADPLFQPFVRQGGGGVYVRGGIGGHDSSRKVLPWTFESRYSMTVAVSSMARGQMV